MQYKGSKDQLTVGGAWSQYNGKHYGEIIWATAGVPDNYRWYNHKAYKTDVNAYAKFQHNFSANLNAFADLQYRYVLYNTDGFRDNPSVEIHETYHFFNPKIGITYSANKYQFYASYSVGQKEPNREDFEAGINQTPKPEKLYNAEIGVEKKTGRYNWGATVYYMRYKDQLVLTGKINDVGAYTRTNIPKSYRLGIELQGKTIVTNWLNLSATLTASHNEIEKFTEYYDDYDNGGQKSIDHGNTAIAYSPDIVGSVSVSFIPLKNLEISLPGKYVSRQFLDNTSNKDRSLAAFYVQDLRIGYTIQKMLFKEINMVFQVNNLFNKEYEPNGYTYSYQYGGSLVTENYYFPMAGINFMMALNLRL
jgi:iron complex outermembrane receptor protein